MILVGICRHGLFSPTIITLLRILPRRKTERQVFLGCWDYCMKKTAKWTNKLDDAMGREVWHNFWETRLTYKRSDLARLNYVHQNPVKHGLVAVANQYLWCSAGWFARTPRPSQIPTIYGFKIDKLKGLDDYDVAAEW